MVTTPICEQYDIDFPLFAFSHCRDVVAAVTNAGGLGVLGGTAFTPEALDRELSWIDEQVRGKPYGVDIIVPAKFEGKGEHLAAGALVDRIPAEYRTFVDELLASHDIPDDQKRRVGGSSLSGDTGEALLEVALRHPIKLMANALGVPPAYMIEAGRSSGVPVAALVGAREHALKQAAAGVDLIVAQGTEAGGHCGEVSTLVLIPEVLDALAEVGSDIPVLAAGGIVTGRQMAACMAMGAAGAWTGSVWLATVESETTEIFREKMIAASSRDAIRSKGRTGKPARQLRSVWTDAWDRGPDSPGALPMPLQSIISRDAFASIDRAAAAGNARARDLVSYFVGQGVGLIDSVKSATAVVQEFKEDFAEAVEHMNALVGE